MILLGNTGFVKLFKLWSKNRKIIVPGVNSANYFCISQIYFIKNGLFLGLRKGFFYIMTLE